MPVIVVDGEDTINLDPVIIPNEDGTFKNELGQIVDKDGNLVVDSNNPPIDNPPADDTPKTVIIDGGEGVGEIEYTLDENGNATLNGEIVYTAQQLKDAGFENDSDDKNTLLDDKNIHKLISDVSGIELLDEEGKPVVFKDGLEGLAEREVYIKNKFLAEGKAQAIKSFLDSDPELADMYRYKQIHGSLKDFASFVDYSTMEITDETSNDVLKSLIREQLLALGNDAAYIDRFIKMSENDETLKADALAALTKLKADQVASKQAADARILEQQQAAIKQVQDYYGITVNEKGEVVDLNKPDSLYDLIVKTGKIGDIFIPTDGISIKRDGKTEKLSRLDLFAYFYNTVQREDGSYQSQAEYDEAIRINDKKNFIVQGLRNLVGDDISTFTKAMKNVVQMGTAKQILKITKGNVQQAKTDDKDILSKIKSGEATIVIE